MEEDFERFKKTGKVIDYLEYAKKKREKEYEKTRNHLKDNTVQGEL